MNQKNKSLKEKNNPDKMRSSEEPSCLETSVKEFTTIDAITKSYSMNGIKTNARIRVEQDVDPF